MPIENSRFTITKRIYDDDALIAFMDLLGTRKKYEETLSNDQAETFLNGLLGEFDIKFSEHFLASEIEDKNFDISIFADSIIISERLQTERFVERLVDFLLDYQDDLYLNCNHQQSRSIITRDSFFSLKLKNVSDDSILSQQCNTSISLCGGKGIKFANDKLKGLPMGVYISANVVKCLSAEQQKRLVPVKDEDLFFIKKKTSIFPYLPDETCSLLGISGAGLEAIKASLNVLSPDKDALRKIKPWILVHLEMQNEIIREKCTKIGSPDSEPVVGSLER